MLIIDNATALELLAMPDCIRVIETAFCGLPSGRAIIRPHVNLYYPCARDDGYFRWGSMEGASDGYFAIRMQSDIVFWPRDERGNWSEDKYCMRPGTYCGLVLLISTSDGEPLAIINDGAVQQMRVGATAGIGAKYLARSDACTVGIIGSGRMARTYLEAFTHVRTIEECRVYSLDAARRERFAAEMGARLGIRVVAVDDPRAAVHGVDIFASCTDSMQPVYESGWLEPGMHVTNLQIYELPADLDERCDVVVRQGPGGLELPESERFQRFRGHSAAAFIGGTAEEMARIPQPPPAPPPARRSRRAAQGGDFADLVTGRCEGRSDPTQITYYVNSGNQGLQFSSVGGLLYELARDKGKGRDIPTEWFLQDLRD
jgi:ornithine cyclodeaminase/alanine dehydrogenase-like protein (mu-crystallin family)